MSERDDDLIAAITEWAELNLQMAALMDQWDELARRRKSLERKIPDLLVRRQERG